MRGRTEENRQAILAIRSSAAALGLRRVDLVRIIVGAAATTCQVVGIGHRVRRTCTVPLATGLRLRDAGVPTVVRSSSSTTLPVLARKLG